MKYSKLFGKTQKTDVSGSAIAGHQLLARAGFIAESTAGRYYFLPLGWRVHEKIRAVIKQEMDAAGAQEMITPVLHPIELWKETNRTNTAGFELTTVTDRRGARFALGGTAEEMFVDLVRKYSISYRDLPFNLYQFSTKFRDELRARGGLLRVREFVMKDAYSFHRDREDFEREYELMAATYQKIFDRLGLETKRVAAGNGYIGGEYSHEFQTPSEVGEDVVFWDKKSVLAYNSEVAPAVAPAVGGAEEQQPMTEVEGKGIVGVEELAEFLKIPVEKTTKTMLFEADKGRMVAVAVRGGYEISEEKLTKVLKCHGVKLADAETVKRLTGAEEGYAGLLNLDESVEVVVDESCKARVNFEMGANRTNYHSINVNWGRDLPEPDEYVDVKIAKIGDRNPDSGEVYETFKSIEVGNIFQLGYHYTELMAGSVFTDDDGKKKPFYMGCYGIGLGRTMAAVAQKHSDERGLVWPKAIAPFQVQLVSLAGAEAVAERVYQELQAAGVEVLWDDRSESAGVKFADCDLIGAPVRLVVSSRNGEKIEYKERSGSDSELLDLNAVVERLAKDKAAE